MIFFSDLHSLILTNSVIISIIFTNNSEISVPLCLESCLIESYLTLDRKAYLCFNFAINFYIFYMRELFLYHSTLLNSLRFSLDHNILSIFMNVYVLLKRKCINIWDAKSDVYSHTLLLMLFRASISLFFVNSSWTKSDILKLCITVCFWLFLLTALVVSAL